MSLMEIEQLYNQHVKSLAPSDRLLLLSVIASNLAQPYNGHVKTRSILELEGLGAEIWEGVDGQAFVAQLREEWDHRP